MLRCIIWLSWLPIDIAAISLRFAFFRLLIDATDYAIDCPLADISLLMLITSLLMLRYAMLRWWYCHWCLLIRWLCITLFSLICWYAIIIDMICYVVITLMLWLLHTHATICICCFSIFFATFFTLFSILMFSPSFLFVATISSSRLSRYYADFHYLADFMLRQILIFSFFDFFITIDYYHIFFFATFHYGFSSLLIFFIAIFATAFSPCWYWCRLHWYSFSLLIIRFLLSPLMPLWCWFRHAFRWYFVIILIIDYADADTPLFRLIFHFHFHACWFHWLFNFFICHFSCCHWFLSLSIAIIFAIFSRYCYFAAYCYVAAFYFHYAWLAFHWCYAFALILIFFISLRWFLFWLRFLIFSLLILAFSPLFSFRYWYFLFRHCRCHFRLLSFSLLFSPLLTFFHYADVFPPRFSLRRRYALLFSCWYFFAAFHWYCRWCRFASSLSFAFRLISFHYWYCHFHYFHITILRWWYFRHCHYHYAFSIIDFRATPCLIIFFFWFFTPSFSFLMPLLFLFVTPSPPLRHTPSTLFQLMPSSSPFITFTPSPSFSLLHATSFIVTPARRLSPPPPA